MEFKSFEEGIEVNGRTVYTIVAGFRVVKSLPSKILLENGIGNKTEDGKVEIEASAWYPQQSWLDAFKVIAKKMGDSVLYQIGLKIPENADFPDWVQDIESAIKSIDIAYHMNHRKNGTIMFNTENGEILEGIGHYGFEKVDGENKIISVCDNPYPCDFDKGIITFMARKFQPKALVKHDESISCRKKGDESCAYTITWKDK